MQLRAKQDWEQHQSDRLAVPSEGGTKSKPHRNTSKKVKAIKMASAQRGERIGTHPSYGYKKDMENNKKIVPDEDTPPVVKYIFDLCVKGFGPSKIARILREEQVLTPQAYILECKSEAAVSPCGEKSYAWLEKTVALILEH